MKIVAALLVDSGHIATKQLLLRLMDQNEFVNMPHCTPKRQRKH